jgi:hypothetical protein
MAIYSLVSGKDKGSAIQFFFNEIARQKISAVVLFSPTVFQNHC